MDIDRTDLAEVARLIQRHIPPNDPPVGYLRGRSYFRDVLVFELRCADGEAEQLVDLLQSHGYLRFLGDPARRSVADSRWQVVDSPR